MRNRALALFILLLTLAPLIIWGLLIARFVPSSGPPPAEDTAELPRGLMLGVVVVPFILLGLMVFYLVHLYRKSGLDTHARVIWLILLVFLNVFAMPFYWYSYIWRERSVGSRVTHA